MASIRDQLDSPFSFAEAWRPSKGDKLVGTVTALNMRDGEYGAYPVVTIREQGGGEYAAHAFHDVLKNELTRVRPQVGEQLGIAYDGKHPERGYHVYRVVSDSTPTGVDWDSIARQSADSGSGSDASADTADLRRTGDDIPF